MGQPLIPEGVGEDAMRSPRFGETLFASTVVSTMVSLLSTTAPAVAQQAAGLAPGLADGAAADGVL